MRGHHLTYLGTRERIGFPDDKLVAPWAGDFYVRRQKLVYRAAQGLYLAAPKESAAQLGGKFDLLSPTLPRLVWFVCFGVG